MKGNQGLEALAALCGGQSDAPTNDTRSATAISRSSSSNNDKPIAATPQAPPQQQQQQQQHQQQPPSQHAQTPQEALIQQGARSNQLTAQQSALQNVSQQQWQQAIAAAAALQGGGINPALAAQSFLLSAGFNQQQHNVGDTAFSAMQQFAFQQYLQQAKAHVQQQVAQNSVNGGSGTPYLDQNQQAIMAALGGKVAQYQQVHGGAHEMPKTGQQQVIPAAPAPAMPPSLPHQAPAPAPTPAPPPPSTGTAGAATAPASSPAQTSMKPPPPPSQGALSLPSTLSTAGILPQQGASNQTSSTPHAAIAPMPGGKILPNPEAMSGSCQSSVGSSVDDKKQQKRAANRRSAQLSRKRKKQFIEELKEENDELRRKEQILRSIPDLIVVFDSSGKLGFVSQSVSRFIDMTPEELEGTSFWDRLCEDSVRLLKAAFMDSLAARKPDSETAPLGSGVWELRLVDKDSSFNIVTLNGVVHFSGEAPECVCCIRPRDQEPIRKLPKDIAAKATSARPVSSSVGSRSNSPQGSSSTASVDHMQIRVQPGQSVISNDTSADDSMEADMEESSKQQLRRQEEDQPAANGRQVNRISDGDSGCEVSESGSDDGVASS